MNHNRELANIKKRVNDFLKCSHSWKRVKSIKRITDNYGNISIVAVWQMGRIEITRSEAKTWDDVRRYIMSVLRQA